jgi:hypothetical protein
MSTIQAYKNATVIETVNSEHNYAMAAVGDKCLVLEDEWRSGNECQRCQGKSYGNKAESAEVSVGSLTARVGIITTIQCPVCKGNGDIESGKLGHSSYNREECRDCNGRGYITCPDCKGIGLQPGKMVTPDSAQQRTSTGVLISMGPMFGKNIVTYVIFKLLQFLCLNFDWFKKNIITIFDPNFQDWSVGDRVSYSNYAGTKVKVEQTVKLLFMREHEILAKVFVLKKDNQTEITDISPATETTESR